MKSRWLAKCLLWIYKNVIVSVLTSFFYATEHGKMKNLVIFYPKNNWSSLVDQKLNSMISSGKLRKLKIGEKNRIARLRFIPKFTGLRPIYPIKMSELSLLEKRQMKLLVSSATDEYNEGLIGKHFRFLYCVYVFFMC